MNDLFEQFLIDAYVVRRENIAADAELRAAWDRRSRDRMPMRLSKLLQQEGAIDQALASKIDERADSYLASLSALGLVSGSLSEDAKSTDVPALSEGEYDTLMEGSHSDSASAPSQPGGVTGDDLSGVLGTAEQRYQKSTPHAEGGLGQVWLATDSELRRKVALKEIQPEHADDPACRLRFINEAEITGALEHPGIVPIYGLGRHADGRPYYVMKFIEGDTLKQAIDDLHRDATDLRYRDAPWKVRFRRILDRLLDVCNTLEYAHSRSVVHRDIKPSNIMLGAFGETLVVDWGLAKTISNEPKIEAPDGVRLSGDDNPELTMLGTAVGTPAYMSPEQEAGGSKHSVTHKSDIFSLGATLFHLLAGMPPKKMGDKEDYARPQSPRELLSDIPAALAAICVRAMSPEPDDRYSSARAMANDLENWLSDQPVNAHEETFTERCGRWVRGHPTAVVSSAVGGVLILAASLAGVFFNDRYQSRIFNEQQQRSRLAESHRQQLSASADAATASALAEIRNNRFEAALEFLDSATTQLEPELELADRLGKIAEIRERTANLLHFYEYTEQAEELTFRDSSRRSSILFQRALRDVGVFKQLEWWNALPTQDLDPQQIHQLRTRVYRAMFLLTALRLKETIPADLDVMEMMKIISAESDTSNRASIVLFDLLDAYRSSQGAELGRNFATERTALLAKALSAVAFQQPLIEWEAKNDSDLYVMGTALAYMSFNTDEQSRKPFETLLGIKDAESVAADMLTQASEMQLEHFWTQLVRAFCEAQRGDHKAAWRSYTHAISLNPNHWVGYAWLGTDQRTYATSLEEDDPDRMAIFTQAARNLERAVDIKPDAHTAHYQRGHTLTWLMQDPRQAISSYIQALNFQEPLDGIRDTVVEQVDRDALKSVSDWCRKLVLESWVSSEQQGCLAWSELQLGNLKEARVAAQDALKLNANDRTALLVLATLDSQELKYEQAEEVLAQLCGEFNWFHCHYVRALNSERAGATNVARESLAKAAEFAETSWQKLYAQKNKARLSLILDGDRGVPDVERAIEVSVTERLDDLLQVANEQGVSTAAALIEDHHASMLPITQLETAKPIFAAPLLNGGFELGLTPCWGDTLDKKDQTAWRRFGGSLALASVGSAHVHSGQRALHIVNDDDQIVREDGGAAQYAELSQVLPIGEKDLELSVWVNSSDSSQDAIEVLANDSVVLSIAGGSYDWRQFRGRFRGRGGEITFRIRCVGKADVWLDSLELIAR